MSERHDLILGAGLAGLTAAYTLQRQGADGWFVIERESRAGGHSRSIPIDGYTFDYGPHILFTTDAAIGALIRELLGENFREQERRALIYHHRHLTYTRFPFQAHLHGLPVELVHECLTGLVEAVAIRSSGGFQPTNYEEWMRGFFGDGIADRLMIPYARKLWTVEPSTMDFHWIDRRVPTPEVERILLGALTNDVELVGATARFWYPWRGGIESLPAALATRVAGIQFDSPVEEIDLDRRVLSVAGGERLAFDRLVYTLPLHELPRIVKNVPSAVRDACHRLEYQSILSVNLGIDRPAIADAHWVYFYEEEFPFHRLSYPGNFSPYNVPDGKSSISIEIAVPRNAEVDTDRTVRKTIEALRTAAILTPEDEISLVDTRLISPAYVIYDLDHRRNVALIQAWLEEQRVWCAGRFGTWGYLNMDHAMRSGQEAAESILAAAST